MQTLHVDYISTYLLKATMCDCSKRALLKIAVLVKSHWKLVEQLLSWFFTEFATLEEITRKQNPNPLSNTDRDLCARSQVSLSHCLSFFRATLNQHSFEWTCDAFAVCFESGLTSSIVFVLFDESLSYHRCESWSSSHRDLALKIVACKYWPTTTEFWLQNANTFSFDWQTTVPINVFEHENVSWDVWNCMHVAKDCITSAASESNSTAAYASLKTHVKVNECRSFHNTKLRLEFSIKSLVRLFN